MSSFVANTTSSGVVDGDVATLLRAVQNSTNIHASDLFRTIQKNLISDDVFSQTLNEVKQRNFIEDTPTGLRLTEAGQIWLSEKNIELGVEQEETLGDHAPKEPYDVSKLNMETRNISVFQALRKIDLEQINLRPEFQRAFVWDVVRQSRLIESILIRIPLPAFYLDATDQVNWNVVDGLQRLTTLHNYCRSESFHLQGLQFLVELEGKIFSELPPKYKVLIEDDTQLLFYNLMPGTPAEAKFTIFSRVNTGGLQLTAQEIRHALNQGPVTRLLAEIAEHPKFREITGGVIESTRMSDRELILRALAFMYFGYENYRDFGELDSFLVHTMTEFNKKSAFFLEQLAAEFLNSIEKVYALFGKYAFRKFYQVNGRRSPFNKALFEVWTTLVRNYEIEYLLDRKSEIIEKFANLNYSSDVFSRSISASTGSTKAVLTRFRFVEDLLKGDVP